MSNIKSYTSVAKEASSVFEEKRSEFISYIKPITDEAQAQEFISFIKSKHYDAKHNVFAYIIKNSGTERYSDDGEPQGTAGMPTLQVLKNEGLTDVIVVTTRYFGGILLGGGGLVRAYTKAAKMAVDAAGLAEYKLFTYFTLTYGYPFHSTFLKITEKANARVENIEYGENITATFAILKDNAEKLTADIFEVSNGTLNCTYLKDGFLGG